MTELLNNQSEFQPDPAEDSAGDNQTTMLKYKAFIIIVGLITAGYDLVILIGMLMYFFGEPGTSGVKAPVISGAEASVIHSGGNEDPIYVKIISGEREHHYGEVSSAESTGSVSGKPLSDVHLHESVEVHWGVEGESGPQLNNFAKLDLSGYSPHAHKVKSVEFIYLGGKKWKFKAYDAPGSDANRKEIEP